MGAFLSAAFLALSDLGAPKSAEEITSYALDEGYLTTSGKTPWQTMKARLSDDVRNKKTLSRFMRAEKGQFALRAWSNSVPEYVADRQKRALLAEDAVVFDRKDLERIVAGPGLHADTIDSPQAILQFCKPMLRRVAELDTSVIQLVSVFIVRHEGHYLTYKRSARLPESRLHGEYSVSFGGHLTPRDLFDQDEWPRDPAGTLWNIFDKENGIFLLQREFTEELRVRQAPHFRYRGLLYDDSREVSRQHLGIVYDTFLISDQYEIGERGFLLDPKFETLDEIQARYQDFENWSHLLIREELKMTGVTE